MPFIVLLTLIKKMYTIGINESALANISGTSISIIPYTNHRLMHTTTIQYINNEMLFVSLVLYTFNACGNWLSIDRTEAENPTISRAVIRLFFFCKYSNFFFDYCLNKKLFEGNIEQLLIYTKNLNLLN